MKNKFIKASKKCALRKEDAQIKKGGLSLGD